MCNEVLQGLDFAADLCHTMTMNNETLSPEILALLADLEADLGVPLDWADDDSDLTDDFEV